MTSEKIVSILGRVGRVLDGVAACSASGIALKAAPALANQSPAPMRLIVFFTKS